MRNRSRSIIVAVVVLATIVAGTTSASGAKKPPKPPSDIRSAPFAFTETDLFKGSPSAFGEPSIALSSKDHVFMCGPQGIGAGNQFVRTPDWKTFETFLITDTPVDGEDCDVKVGSDDAVYEATLQIAAGAIRKSVADGQGPPAPPNTFGNGSFDYQVTEDPVEQDRQWLRPDAADARLLSHMDHPPPKGGPVA